MSIKCCFSRCEKEAEFIIIYGNAPNDATESCASHIGHLIDDNVDSFEVVRIIECEICYGAGSTYDHHDPCSNCSGKGYII